MEREELDFCQQPMPSKNSFFGDVNNSKFDLISEIQEDEFDSATKKEEINFDCDYSSINLDISRNSVFWAENTKILNEIEREDYVVKTDRPSLPAKELERPVLKEQNFFLKDNFIKETQETCEILSFLEFFFLYFFWGFSRFIS